jgi:hypothetical protein
MPEATVYEVAPVSLSNGEFAAAWFDDEERLWDDDRLHKPQSILAEWQAPVLVLHRPERGATEVLFNPNAYAVSSGVREVLAAFPEIEFLPIQIADHGTFFLLHVVACGSPPMGCVIRKAAGPSGNISEVKAFPAGFVPGHAFFRLSHPPKSAAGRAGYCTHHIFANAEGARALDAACGSYLSARRIRHA